MNKVAIVTGGSRGIGRGIATELAMIGFDLVINYKSDATAAEEATKECIDVATKYGHTIRVEMIQGDITSAKDRANLIELTRTRFKRLDVLVNNAGVAPQTREDILDASEESFDRLITTNLKGPYFLTQLAAKWMIEQQTSGKMDASFLPMIITISSISAYTASVTRGDYCISKAGLSMLTALFAARLAEYGINVYEIRPGIISTDMTIRVQAKYSKLIEEGLTPIKRWGHPEDVGKAVAALASGVFPFSTGEIFNIDGGFHLRRL